MSYLTSTSRRVIARSAAGILVAGLVATAILTSIASSAPASAAASPAAAHGRSTVTQTTSTSVGTVTVQVKDQRTRRGLTVSLATYSVTAAMAIKHPSFSMVFAPSGPPMVHRQVNRRIVVFHVSLKGPLTSFSGALPARVIAEVNKNGGLRGSYTLIVTVGNIIKKTHRSITARLLMQEGLDLTPVLFFVRPAPR